MSLIEKYNAELARQERGPLEIEEMSPELARLMLAREWMFLNMIYSTRCQAAECCAEAKALFTGLDQGDLMILVNTDETLELNNASGAAMKWDTQKHVGGGFSHNPGVMQRSKGTVTQDGWYRIYALLTYSSATADTSIRIEAKVNGVTTLLGDGRHGYISNNSGHTTASSSLETFEELSANDYVEIITWQNGAAGAVNPIANKSLFIMERRPYPPSTPAEPV